MKVSTPRVLELTVGSTAIIRATLVSSYEQGLPANTSGATSAVLSISESLDSTPFYIKTGAISEGIATFSPSQGEANAWSPGTYVGMITTVYPSGVDKTDWFHVAIAKSLPHA